MQPHGKTYLTCFLSAMTTHQKHYFPAVVLPLFLLLPRIPWKASQHPLKGNKLVRQDLQEKRSFCCVQTFPQPAETLRSPSDEIHLLGLYLVSRSSPFPYPMPEKQKLIT